MYSPDTTLQTGLLLSAGQVASLPLGVSSGAADQLAYNQSKAEYPQLEPDPMRRCAARFQPTD